VHLRFFESEIVRRVTGSTSFDIDALIAGKPMTLYIIVPPSRLTAFRPLLRLWISGLLFALTQRNSIPEYRTLMLCDEIGNVGRIEAFLMASTLMRGFGLTLWSFWQNAAQLKIYGDQANTLIDNAGVVQLFGARNRRMAGEFAALVGGIDADAVLKLGSGDRFCWLRAVSRSSARRRGIARSRCSRTSRGHAKASCAFELAIASSAPR
jgi:type IV secretion system protein VirD4